MIMIKQHICKLMNIIVIKYMRKKQGENMEKQIIFNGCRITKCNYKITNKEK